MNVAEDFSLLTLLTLMSIDNPSPFARLRGAGEASKAKPTDGHVTKGTTRAMSNPNPRPGTHRAAHLSSKRGQAMRAAPTPTGGQTKQSSQINTATRPATATGRMASTSGFGPVPTPRILARPATSASLRPPTAVTRTVRLPTKSQTGTISLAADPEIILEFEGVDVGNDDFIFDV